MTAAVLNGIPADLKSFIDKFITSYIAWDILTFFYDTRSKVKADSDEVSMLIGRDGSHVYPVIELMKNEGILSCTQENGRTIYSTNLQGQFYQVIRDFFEFTAKREGRLKTIYMITEKRFYRN